MTQKKDIKRQKTRLDAMKREAEEERARARAEARERVLHDFERGQGLAAGIAALGREKDKEQQGQSHPEGKDAEGDAGKAKHEGVLDYNCMDVMVDSSLQFPFLIYFYSPQLVERSASSTSHQHMWNGSCKQRRKRRLNRSNGSKLKL